MWTTQRWLRQEVLVITPLPNSVRCLKSSCAFDSRQQHGDTLTATDFLEAVKVIDLSHDRLKDIKRVSQREIKAFPQVTPDFYLGRGLNLLRVSPLEQSGEPYKVY